jgi:hypothetical protein
MIVDTYKYIWLSIICRYRWNSVISLTNNGLVAPEKEGVMIPQSAVCWFRDMEMVLVVLDRLKTKYLQSRIQ